MKSIEIEVENEFYVDYAIELATDEIMAEIESVIENPKFLEYFAKQCENALKKIAINELSSINTEEDIEKSDYMNGMGLEIKEDEIYLFNNSVIDVPSKKMSPEKRKEYPFKLSLAKIVEYGIGYTGWINPLPLPVDWKYDVNNHGFKGWYYEDNNGQVHWTNGFAGRGVFLKLSWWIAENAKSIIQEFIKNNM